MQNVLSAIKWSVCITIRPAGDIYSRTLAHAPARCTKGLVTASTIPQRSSASVLALLRSLILDRTKLSTSNCRSFPETGTRHGYAPLMLGYLLTGNALKKDAHGSIGKALCALAHAELFGFSSQSAICCIAGRSRAGAPFGPKSTVSFPTCCAAHRGPARACGAVN